MSKTQGSIPRADKTLVDEWFASVKEVPHEKRCWTDSLRRIGLSLKSAVKRIVYIQFNSEEDVGWAEWFIVVKWKKGYVVIGGADYEVRGGHSTYYGEDPEPVDLDEAMGIVQEFSWEYGLPGEDEEELEDEIEEEFQEEDY
jgi:hypothetical protein